MDNTIFLNGDIITGNRERPKVEAMYVENGKIIDLGDNIDMISYDCENIVDLRGNTVVPGFIDSHSHFIKTGYQMNLCDVSFSNHCFSIEDVVDRLKDYIKGKQFSDKHWIVGMGYDESGYPKYKSPTKHDLDLVSIEYPVVIVHSSGHSAIMNTKGLELCGIDKNYKCPEGGEMPKFSNREYTGLLKEKAYFRVKDYIKTPRGLDNIMGIKKANELYASYGVTTAQEASVAMDDYKMILQADKLGALTIDLNLYFKMSCAFQVMDKHIPLEKREYNEHIRKTGCTILIDGPLRTRTAWLTYPYPINSYFDKKEWYGIANSTDPDVISKIKECLENDWQIIFLTNGDQAIDQMIRCYKEAKKDYPQKTNIHPVAIHCFNVRKDQLVEFKDLGIYISFYHDQIHYWGDYFRKAIIDEKTFHQLCPIKWAMDLNIVTALHQNSPSLKPNMIMTISNAINRHTLLGEEFDADLAVSPLEALFMVTLYPARQMGLDQEIGSLEKGKRADFAVLSENPLSIDKTRIKDIYVVATIKDGQYIYKRKAK